MEILRRSLAWHAVSRVPSPATPRCPVSVARPHATHGSPTTPLRSRMKRPARLSCAPTCPTLRGGTGRPRGGSARRARRHGRPGDRGARRRHSLAACAAVGGAGRAPHRGAVPGTPPTCSASWPVGPAAAEGPEGSSPGPAPPSRTTTACCPAWPPADAALLLERAQRAPADVALMLACALGEICERNGDDAGFATLQAQMAGVEARGKASPVWRGHWAIVCAWHLASFAKNDEAMACSARRRRSRSSTACARWVRPPTCSARGWRCGTAIRRRRWPWPTGRGRRRSVAHAALVCRPGRRTLPDCAQGARLPRRRRPWTSSRRLPARRPRLARLPSDLPPQRGVCAAGHRRLR